MILAETTVVIQFLRAPTARLQQIIQGYQAAVCGVTVAEVFAGARTAAELASYPAVLSVFGTVAVPGDVWDRLGRNLFVCLRSGLTVPFPDALLATVAIDHDLELWTHDRHFRLIQTVLPALRLFQEPP